MTTTFLRRTASLTCIACLAVPVGVSGGDASALAKANRGGIALLTGYTNGKSITGTGFLVDDRVVVTNAHVVKGAKAMVAEFDGGHKIDCSLIDMNEDVDLAALSLEKPLPDRALQHRGQITVKQGEEVMLIGHPLGLKWSVHKGIIAAITTAGEIAKALNEPVPDNPGQVAFQLNIDSTFGMSGAPVLNSAGEVIGVQKSGVGGGESGIAFCIPYESVSALNLKKRPKRFEGSMKLDDDFKKVGLQKQSLQHPIITVDDRRVEIGCQHWGFVQKNPGFIFNTYIGDKQRFQAVIPYPMFNEILQRNNLVYVTNSAFGFRFLAPTNYEFSQKPQISPPGLEITLTNRNPPVGMPNEFRPIVIKAWRTKRLTNDRKLAASVREMVESYASESLKLRIFEDPYTPLTSDREPSDVVVFLAGSDQEPRTDAALSLARYSVWYFNSSRYNRAWRIYGAISGETATITAFKFMHRGALPGITPDSAERQFIAETLSFNVLNNFAAEE